MRRILVLLTVMALLVVMMAMAVGPAFAGPPSPASTNPSGKQHSGSGSYNSNNCVAEGSAQVIRNGPVVKGQDRGHQHDNC